MLGFVLPIPAKKVNLGYIGALKIQQADVTASRLRLSQTGSDQTNVYHNFLIDYQLSELLAAT